MKTNSVILNSVNSHMYASTPTLSLPYPLYSMCTFQHFWEDRYTKINDTLVHRMQYFSLRIKVNITIIIYQFLQACTTLDTCTCISYSNLQAGKGIQVKRHRVG